MSLRDGLGLAVALALVALAAGFGSRFRPGAWYRALDKPAWTPPNGIFAPVWTLLYAAMAVAAWEAWRASAGASAAFGLALWAAQLAANAAWSWLFFGRRRIGAALLDILMLAALIAATAAAFFRASTLAGALMLPYLAWVLFASALNLSLWRRNRGAGRESPVPGDR